MPPQQPPRAPAPRNDADDAAESILKNFTVDDEDSEQLSTGGENEDLFDADEDDGPPSRSAPPSDDDQEEPGSEQESTTEPVVEEPPEQKPDKFSFQEDREGNFIDKDGRILVRKGRQRDLFVKIKRAWSKELREKNQLAEVYQTTVAAARELLDRYNRLKADKTHAESLGLTDEEAKEAAEIRAMVKIDPKAGVRKILTMLHLGGTDLSDLGVTGPLDAKTVAAHMLELQEAKRPKEPTDEDKAREEVVGFLSRHPDARKYSGVLAEAKRRFPLLTYDQLWIQLVLHQSRQKPTNGAAGDPKPPQKPFARNSQRTTEPVVTGKLSLKAVDPSQSFTQIGRDLLRDIQALERNG